MSLLLLAACAAPPWGTWAFTLEVTEPTGEECVTTLSHNFSGADEPTEAVVEETWTTSSATSSSPQLFFGRVEASGQGAMLIVGAEAFPGTQEEDGSWTFDWTGSNAGLDEAQHASGYAYSHPWEDTNAVRLSGAFNTDTFTGTYGLDSSNYDKWDESDTWSEEAAAYVGENGEAPVGTYLVLTDGSGAEVAANNARSTYDCENAGCTLSVESACAYRYDVSAVLTDFEGADANWTEDAGQAPGL